MIYIPTSLDQPVGAPFGVQAGFAELSSSITQGGFAKVRKAAAASPPLDGDLNPSSRPSGSAACRLYRLNGACMQNIFTSAGSLSSTIDGCIASD
jgi:hypothetical protein